jgi:hypothetical protein
VYYDSIPVDSQKAFLDQCASIAALGASDPLVKRFPTLR